MAKGIGTKGKKPKKGPRGPKRSLAGKSGTNRMTPVGGAATSGPAPPYMC